VQECLSSNNFVEGEIFMRRACQPCLVGESGEQLPLTRVSFSDRRVAEKLLQSILHQTPQILPVDEFDASFGPLISLGREIDNIDNLFISPRGRLTIVETKLWRNPEATREVVAQILEYAAQVSSWSYSELEDKLRKTLSPAEGAAQSLYELVKRSSVDEELCEADFIDSVQRTLKNGRFLLLVVGDGIRENIESLLELLHKHPQKLFTFGLIELQIFKCDKFPHEYLIVPQIVANTTEIVRAVVRVETTGTASVSVEIEDNKSISSRGKLSQNEFFDQIKDDDIKAVYKEMLDIAENVGAVLSWGSSSVSVRLPDPTGSKILITLYVMTTNGEAYTGWMAKQLERTKRSPYIAKEYVEQLCALFPSVSPKINTLDSLSGTISAKEIGMKIDEFAELVKDVVERIKKTG
jgi:hypothetical protein